VTVGAAMVSVMEADEPVYGPLPVEASCAVTTTLKLPPAVGVPVSRPEDESERHRAGR
jgi:hypothetical protein